MSKLNADGATATLQSGGEGGNEGATKTIRARWIVGCEGAKSVVREAARIGRQGGQNAGVQIVQGDLRVQTTHTLPPGHAFLWSRGTRSSLLLLPLHRDGHYRVLVVRDDNGEHGEPTPAQIQAKKRVASIAGFDRLRPALVQSFSDTASDRRPLPARDALSSAATRRMSGCRSAGRA